MSQAWFRMYSTFMGDPVVQSLSFEMQRHYVIVLCIKADGILDRKVAKSVRESMITKALGVTESEKISIKKALKDAALVDDNWQPAGWSKRQYKSDDSTQRVRKYRKNKEAGNVSVTECETAEETFLERFCNVPRARATETETETELLKGRQAGSGDGSDPKAALWKFAVSILGEQSRSLIGKAVSQHGEGKVGEALAATAKENPADPKTYFLGCLPKPRRVVV